QKEILTMISENNKISKKGIAQHLEINSSAVDKHIDALKAKG
ncbi:MAG: HTH domain-containing protein, partial [Spirochaetales bacterium]|nr:HTH domain-containing protein [Spirochaetales bacterium]